MELRSYRERQTIVAARQPNRVVRFHGRAATRVERKKNGLGWVGSVFAIFTTQPEPTQPEHSRNGSGRVLGLAGFSSFFF